MATIFPFVNERIGGIGVTAVVVYDPNTLSYVRMQQPILEAGTVTLAAAVNQGTAGSEKWLVTADISASQTIGLPTGQGKTLLFVAIAQGAAGTTQLVAANATKKIKVCSYTFIMSLAGTVKFADGAADLTGAMPIVASGGVSANGQTSSHLFETAVNSALSIVTTVGAATGHLSYFLEA